MTVHIHPSVTTASRRIGNLPEEPWSAMQGQAGQDRNQGRRRPQSRLRSQMLEPDGAVFRCRVRATA